jgi:hypothetical protein
MHRAFGALVAVVPALVGGCVSDHDALVRRDGPGTAGRGGSGGSGGRGGSVGQDADAGETGDADAESGDAGATDGPREPDGADRLTLFHGVVDAPRVAFCVVRQPEGQAPQPVEPLLPRTGLDFGAPIVVSDLAGVDFARDALRLIVVAGSAPDLGASSCVEALTLAEPNPADAATDPDAATTDGSAVPSLRAQTLPLLPAGTLANARSFMLVATGCLGATAHDAPESAMLCGAGYAPTRPTLGMVLAPMSRRTLNGRLGLQLLHASRATDAIVGVSVPPVDSGVPALFVVSDVVHGQIAPRLANVDRAKVAYGTPIEASQIDIRRKAPGTVIVPWGEALARGGVPAVADGRNYTIVFVGPLPGASADWANPPTVTVVENDPEP